MKKLSVNLIVKDEETNLPKCLNSIKEVADEIVIVDTGSSDRTVEIAESFNAKIFHVKWNNDFSEARNYALHNSIGDWILYIDADEILSPESIPELKKIINQHLSAVRCRVKSVGKNLSKNGIMKYPRLFPRDTRIIFEGKVHEQILPSIQQNKIKIIDSGIEIIHFGYDIEQEAMQKKLERNLFILHQELEQNGSSYTHLRVGQTLFAMGKYLKAADHFSSTALDKTAPDYQRATALLHLSLISSANNELDNALGFALNAEKLSPQKPYLLYLLMKLFLKQNDQVSACKYAAKAMKANNDLLNGNIDFENETVLNQMEVIFWNILLAKRSRNFVLTNKLMGELTDFIPLTHQHIVKILKKIINNEKIDELEISAVIAQIDRHSLEPFVEVLKDYSYVDIKYSLLSELSAKIPDDPNLLNQLGLVCNQITRTDEAIEHLERSCKVDSKNPATYFYLISCYVAIKQFDRIPSLITDVEINFQNYPEVISRIGILKDRLASYLINVN